MQFTAWKNNGDDGVFSKDIGGTLEIGETPAVCHTPTSKFQKNIILNGEKAFSLILLG